MEITLKNLRNTPPPKVIRARHEKLSGSRSHQRNVQMIVLMIFLNNHFLNDNALDELIRTGEPLYQMTPTHSQTEQFYSNVSEAVMMTKTLKLDRLFVYLFVDEFAQEMLEHVRNPARKAFWTDLYDYVSTRVAEFPEDADVYEDANTFWERVLPIFYD